RARCTHLQTQPGRIQPIDSSHLAAIAAPRSAAGGRRGATRKRRATAPRPHRNPRRVTSGHSSGPHCPCAVAASAGVRLAPRLPRWMRAAPT
ncbi:hypothetical protein, partial [Bordetella pertussis]